MASSTVKNMRLAGVASAAPAHTETVADLAKVFGNEDAERISESTGVVTRHVSLDGLCTSDLCRVSADRLLDRLEWSRDTVDVLVFVTQTPDYILPATSCCLQDQLGLAKACASFDVNLGCSGYVYGLWLASSLLSTGAGRRALVLVGDTSPHVSPLDRSAVPLFGDAGTATALEVCEGATPWFFELGTDGAGAQNLIIPAGGFRRPRTPQTAERTEREGGNLRSDEELYMNGAEIFTFTLREVPSLVRGTLAAAGWTVDDVDAYVFHQANRFMLKHLAKKMKLPAEKVVLDLEEFGNTSSASIPLAMTNRLAEPLTTGPKSLLLAGFGVGYSWGAAALRCGPCEVCGPFLVSEPPEMNVTEFRAR